MPNIRSVCAIGLFSILASLAHAQEEMPVIVNEQTGEQVALTRAYWNANVDIANRSIRCDGYKFNTEASVYEPAGGDGHPSGFFLQVRSQIFKHHPLTEQFTHSYVENGFGDFRRPDWQVIDGIYSGVANISMGRYIELVSYDPTTRTIGQHSDKNAIRVWHSAEQVSGSAYSVCYDDEGARFLPTGSADTGNTNLVDLDEVNDFSFQYPAPVGADVEVPAIYARDTGERVQFVRGEWNFNQKLALRSLDCDSHFWNGEHYERQPDSSYLFTYYAYFGGDVVISNGRIQDLSFPQAGSSQIDDFKFYGYSDSNYPFVELTDSGFRKWSVGSDGSGYTACTFSRDFTPNRLLPIQPANCDYSNADRYDGWGWNQQAQIGCPPQVTTASNTSDVDPSGTSTQDEQTLNDAGDSAVTDDTSSQTNNTIDTSPTENTTGTDDTSSMVSTDDIDASDDQSNDTADTSSTGNTVGTVTADVQSSTDPVAQSAGGGAFGLWFLMLVVICLQLGRCLRCSNKAATTNSRNRMSLSLRSVLTGHPC